MEAYLDFIHSLKCDLLIFLNLGLLNILNEIYNSLVRIFFIYVFRPSLGTYFPPVVHWVTSFCCWFQIMKAYRGVFWNHLLSHFLKSYSIVSVNIVLNVCIINICNQIIWRLDKFLTKFVHFLWKLIVMLY